MSNPIPEHLHLGQLRRQAKELRDATRRGDPHAAERVARHHRSASAGAVTLAVAQFVIARELGFPSWPRLKAAIDAIDADRAQDRAAHELADACVAGRLRQAAQVLRANPGIAGRSLLAAAVLGDAQAVRETLAADRAAAVAIDDDRGWPPLLYACYSRWHQADPGRASQIADVVRLLLDAGASPNTGNGARVGYRSALTGSVEVNNPEVTKALLEAGANPDDRQVIGAAAFNRHHECLELLLAHGARVDGTWAVYGAMGADDARVVSLLLDELRTSPGRAARLASESLADAAEQASLPVVIALLDGGADPRVKDDDGISALARAVRAGKDETAARLRDAGADDDSTDVDRFIGACLNGDRVTAERLLADHPGLRDRFDDKDRAAIVVAAGSRPAGTVALMCDLGFSPCARNGQSWGEQPLHSAAYYGNADAVRVLLEAGADVDARDTRFDATPLCYATVGSGEQAGKPGDWIQTVRLLIEAGAARDDVWVTDKPPSEEVMDLLRGYGISPGEAGEAGEAGEVEEAEEMEAEGADEVKEAQEVGGTGVMADIARHLQAAFADQDLELLASLLHPQVRWANCGDRTEVLDWYRQVLLPDVTSRTLDSVEVDRDAVILGVTISWRAEGARPAPPQRHYQVFTVAGAEIVQIHGYPDRAAALART